MSRDQEKKNWDKKEYNDGKKKKKLRNENPDDKKKEEEEKIKNSIIISLCQAMIVQTQFLSARYDIKNCVGTSALGARINAQQFHPVSVCTPLWNKKKKKTVGG